MTEDFPKVVWYKMRGGKATERAYPGKDIELLKSKLINLSHVAAEIPSAIVALHADAEDGADKFGGV